MTQIDSSRETKSFASSDLNSAFDELMRKPGDVLLFRWRAGLPAKHAAILVTPERMIHAHDGAAVAEVYFAPWWHRRLAYAFLFHGILG